MLKQQTASQSQKLMVFVLTMSLYGLATLFTELIPSFQVGIVEFSVEYFLFIPLVLAMLFDPMSAALGAAAAVVSPAWGQSKTGCRPLEHPCRNSGRFLLEKVLDRIRAPIPT